MSTEPTIDDVRRTLKESFGLTGDTDLQLQHSLLREVLRDHWIEEPLDHPVPPVAGWEGVQLWEMSYVGDGGAWSIVARCLARNRADALVALAGERLAEVDDEMLHDSVVALSSELLMHGRARVYREGDT